MSQVSTLLTPSMKVRTVFCARHSRIPITHLYEDGQVCTGHTCFGCEYDRERLSDPNIFKEAER